MKKVIVLILLIFSAGIVKAQNSLFDKDTLARNENFRQRVKSAGIEAAKNIAADTSKIIPSYERSYANEIIKNPDGGWIAGMAYQVASGFITYESDDNAIQFTVNASFEKLARAYYNILPQQSTDTTVINAQ